jgi:hypothetical protein
VTVIDFEPLAARCERVQVIVCGLLSVSGQLKPPGLTESTIRRGSTVSVRLTLSASETPLLLRLSVKVLLGPPAVTEAESKLLLTVRWTSSTIATESEPVAGVDTSSEVAEPLLPTDGSLSVVEATW